MKKRYFNFIENKYPHAELLHSCQDCGILLTPEQEGKICETAGGITYFLCKKCYKTKNDSLVANQPDKFVIEERESYCRDIRRSQISKDDIQNHKKYNQGLFNDDIIEILDEKVQSLTKEHWATDKCPPEFLVTLNNEDMNNQKILITVNHLGYKFTEVLFPRTEAQWGYDSVLNQMINIYNKTM